MLSKVLVVAAGLLALADSARGLDFESMDRRIDPCVDFYAHANAGWLARNPVPSAYSSWGTFNEIEDGNNDRLLAIARAAARADAAEGSPEWLVGNFFRAATDEAEIERLGLEPLKADLDAIAAIDESADLVALLPRWHREGLPILFGLTVWADLKYPSRHLAYVGQGGLGLPNREFYLREDAASRAQLGAYRSHVARMLVLAGSSAQAAAEDARSILALETRLARAHLPREELRNPERHYHPMGLARASQHTPGLDWGHYFQAVGLPRVHRFSLAQPRFFGVLARALREESAASWRAYARWHLLRGYAAYLHSALADERFDFYGRTLKGQKQQRRREIRAIEQINERLSEPLGRLFVARHFPPASGAHVQALIGHLQAALRERLETLSWLGTNARKEALDKLRALRVKIGHPAKWRDYAGLRLDPATHLANVRALAAFEQAREFARIDEPVDHGAWEVGPQQLNAYYNPAGNEIVFPAGILQAPLFDPAADDAANFGAIGTVIGHEVMHGYDDAGSRFDALGRMRDWWSDEDREGFEARAQKLVDQAGEFEAAAGLRLNGRLSLGENVADLGGLAIAYRAMLDAQGDHPAIEIHGYTPQQRFFLAWAQVWRRNATAQALALQLRTGPHAPARFRVNGPLSNLPEFRAAFGCKPGDPMVRDEALRVELW